MTSVPSRALVRPVPASYAGCLRETACDIDVELARRQHAAYVAALGEAGVETIVAPVLDDAPDSVFIEDAMVVLERRALLGRSGAPSRRRETSALAGYLASFELAELGARATLDGGDVLRVGDRLFVGLTARTNRAGFDVLAALARADGLEPVAIELAAGLHLKSFVTALGDGVIGCFDRIDPGPFRARGIETIEAPELAGANLLDLGDRVLVSAAAPKTAALVGARALVVDVGEFHKGDGALTCLSVRFPPA